MTAMAFGTSLEFVALFAPHSLRKRRAERPHAASSRLVLATRRGLTALGHRVVETALPLGGAQCVAIDWERGTLSAASDSRKDGLALCY